MTEPKLTSSIQRALTACRRARVLLDEPGTRTEPVDAKQRQRCREQLDAMIAQLTSQEIPDRANRVSWMGQMVADQWDPFDELTSAVISAEREYVRIP